MKKIGLLLILLISASCFGIFTYPPQPKTRPAKEFPGYLLVLRYWSYSPSIALGCNSRTSENYETSNGWQWTYLYETYDSLSEVTNRLNTYTGSGLDDPNELVGLWRLDKNLADTLLSLKKIKHIEPKHVEKIEWTEYNWKIVEPNK